MSAFIPLVVLVVLAIWSIPQKKTVKRTHRYNRNIFGQFAKQKKVIWVSQLGENI